MQDCPTCGAVIPSSSLSGLCPVCLLDGALEDPADDDSLSALAPGSTFGQFSIVRLLNRGGMAAVYEAREENLERVVALKILSPQFLHDQSFAHRFEREARLVARLEHSHIVPIYASGIANGMPWLSMRLLSGGTLSDRLTGVPLATGEAVRILRGVVRALDHAHARGVIHRDVKPSNILLDDAGNACVADFGVARLMEQGITLTNIGAIIGTPMYMAPEQARGVELDHRCDLYSLGVVAYEMLTGTPPFKASTPLALLTRHTNDPVPTPPRKLVSRAIAKVLRKALAKRPEDRWSTGAAFVDALEAAVRHTPMWLPRVAAAGVLATAVIAYSWVRPTPDSVPLAATQTIRPFVPYLSSSTPVRPEIGDASEGLRRPLVDDVVKPAQGGAEEESQIPPAEETEDKPQDPRPSDPPKPAVTSTEVAPTGEEEPNPPKPLLPVDSVTSTTITDRVEPVYPPLARAAGIQGDVLIEADCAIDGRLANLTIVRSADRILEAAAVNAVRQYKCNPRQRNGQPEVSRLPVLVSFRLK